MNAAVVSEAIQRTHLFPFSWKAFELLHPGTDFVPSWHVEAICHALEQVASGATRRLVITVPPRHGKSICAAVALPAWMLGHDPSLKIMVASYGGDLAAKHARDFRAVFTSPWYQHLFPHARLAEGGNRADEQITTGNGGRKAVSLGGAVTGFGADLIIVDDLMKAADASSPVERQRARDYYEQSLLSRLNDKGTGRVIVIQQRLHEDDLPGHLLASKQFEHLNLPAIAEENQTVPVGLKRLRHRVKGEALCPERESLQVLEQLRVEMGPAVFSAQYQQDPTPPGGNRLRWEWFGTYEPDLDRSDFQYVVQSWDTALTAEPTSDFSVGMTWGLRNGQWYLLDLVREKLDFPDLKALVLHFATHWKADRVLIEKAASGYPLLQQLHREQRGQETRYMGILAKLDKRTRFEAQTARLATQNYLLPIEAPWLTDLRRELLAFPNGSYDDQVDSLVQFLEWSASPRAKGSFDRDPVTGRPVGRLPRRRI